MTKTLAALIAAHPDDAQALGAPDRTWLNYSGLRSLAADVAQTWCCQTNENSHQIASAA